MEINIWIHSFSCLASHLTLISSDILLPKQELPVEVADFDVIVVSAGELALSSNTHQSSHLDKLTTQSSSAH